MDSGKKSAQDSNCKVDGKDGTKCHIIKAAREWCTNFIEKADKWNKDWGEVFGKKLPIVKRAIVTPKRTMTASQKKKKMKVD